MRSLVLYLSLFHLLHHMAVATENQLPYKPTDYLLLDCGSSTNSTSTDGRSWVADSQYSLPASTASYASQQDPSVTQGPYTRTARIFLNKSTYSFRTVSPGPKFVRLYFYPATYPGQDITKSYFNVTANGFTLLSNFSAFLTVSGNQRPFTIKEYIVTVKNNQNLNITFIPLPNSFAFINGIEVVSMPNDLYMNTSEGVPFVNYNDLFYFDDTTALETVYRVNVGGQYISNVNDSGMFRNWDRDDMYTVPGSSGVVPFGLSDVKIHYTEDTPAYTAPEMVYTTYRSMGRDINSSNEKSNVTWLFPVDDGFSYLIRLHFCEIQTEVTGMFQRVFSIFINNQTAEPQADVMSWSHGSRIPVYKDYVVLVPNERDGGEGIWLALHPNMASKPKFADVLLNGLEIFKLNNSDGSLGGPNPGPIPTNFPLNAAQYPSLKSKKNRKTTIAVIGGAIAGIALLSILGFLALRRRKRARNLVSAGDDSCSRPFHFTQIKSTKTQGSSLPSNLCRQFVFAEIKAATKNFDDVLIIGVGGFGNVYKGYIDGGTTAVAIKRLKSGSQQGAQEFITEIATLSQLRHLNLVSLIGYCNDDREMILVYEYMAHGTLRDHLYNSANSPLSWKQRLEICLGAARGLQYLHCGANHMIIHRDVKTTNILLDDKWVAKVSDFGLSKLGPTSVSQTHVSTVVKGSFGYLDPEYFRLQQLTEKSDVYSFGVVLCEVLCARPPLLRSAEKERVNLAEWARECYCNEMLDKIVDPFLKGQITPECLNKFGEVAVNCLLDEGINRPTMDDVVGGLEYALQLQESAKDPSLVGVTKGTLFQKFSTGDNNGIFTTSSELGVSDSKSSSVIMTNSGDENSTNQDSDSFMTGTVFSELMDAKGR